jgi:hypothetical protein
MTERNEHQLLDLRQHLAFVLSAPLDFRQTDPETTLAQVRHLTAAATYFNLLAISDFHGRSGKTRAPGLVEQTDGLSPGDLLSSARRYTAPASVG